MRICKYARAGGDNFSLSLQAKNLLSMLTFMNTKKVFSLFMVSLALHTSQAQTSYPWMDTTKSFYERALLLCKELTLREKVDQLGNNVSEPVVRNGL